MGSLSNQLNKTTRTEQKRPKQKQKQNFMEDNSQTETTVLVVEQEVRGGKSSNSNHDTNVVTTTNLRAVQNTARWTTSTKDLTQPQQQRTTQRQVVSKLYRCKFLFLRAWESWHGSRMSIDDVCGVFGFLIFVFLYRYAPEHQTHVHVVNQCSILLPYMTSSIRCTIVY